MANIPDGTPLISDSHFCNSYPTHIYGAWADGGGNTMRDSCLYDCADITGDGYVNISDLLAVIDQWGLTDSPADINSDGSIDMHDLLIVISNWGPCE